MNSPARVRTSLIAASAFATMLACLGGTFPAESHEVQRSLTFIVKIPGILRVKTIESPRALKVTSEDAARGYVDLDDVTVVSVQNNCRSGVTVDAGLAGDRVASVDMHVAGTPGSGDSAYLQSWGNEPKLLHFGYRLHLKPEAAAGEFAWPVSLRFANCA